VPSYAPDIVDNPAPNDSDDIGSTRWEARKLPTSGYRITHIDKLAAIDLELLRIVEGVRDFGHITPAWIVDGFHQVVPQEPDPVAWRSVDGLPMNVGRIAQRPTDKAGIKAWRNRRGVLADSDDFRKKLVT